MDAGNAHIIEAHDLIAQHLRCDGSLLGNRDVAGAAGCDHHAALSRGLRQLPDHAGLGELVIFERKLGTHKSRRLFGQARDEDGLLPVFHHGLRNAQDVLLRLARAVDHLRHALADAAVKVHLGIFTDLLKRLHLELERRVLGADRPGGDLVKQRRHLRFVHSLTSRASVQCLYFNPLSPYMQAFKLARCQYKLV